METIALLNAAAQLALIYVQSLPPADQQAAAHQAHEDLEKLRNWCDTVIEKVTTLNKHLFHHSDDVPAVPAV